jgi:hypothetical protein
MIVISTPFIAEREPRADVTKFDRLRICTRSILRYFLKIAFNLSEIGGIMRHEKRLWLCTAAQHHMHPL